MNIPYHLLFQAIIEQTGDGIALANKQGNYVLVNPALCQMTGYDQGELQQMGIRNLMIPETTLELFPQVLQGKGGKRTIYLKRKDGSSFPAEITGYPIELEKQLFILGIVRDMTAFKEQERAIRESEERALDYLQQTEHLHYVVEQLNQIKSLPEVYEIAVQGICTILKADRASLLLFDQNGRMHFKAWHNLSKRYRQLVDGHCPWHISDVNAQPIFYNAVSTPEFEPALFEALQEEGIGALLFVPLIQPEQLIGKFMVYFNKPHQFTEQDLHLAQVIAQNLSSIINRMQTFEAMQQTAVDLRQMVQALEQGERKIAELAEFSQSIVASAPIGIVTIDKTGTITSANEAFIKMVDSPSLEETLKLDINIPTLRAVGFDKALQAVLSAGEIVSINQIEYTSHWGKTITVNFKVVPQKQADGHITGAIIVIDDVTANKQAEIALQNSNQQLQTALAELKEAQENMVQRERLAAVGQLAAGIAHDFNNIMAVIVLYTEMSLRLVDMPNVLRKRLETILREAWRATELVQQILDFSRRSILEPKAMELVPFLKEQVKLLNRTLPENIHLRLTFNQQPYTIHADPTRIQQIVMNLVVNARDAMRHGGELGLTLSHVDMANEVLCAACQRPFSGSWITLTVQDTGCGIPQENLPRIFEPFFTTKPVGEGSGLGLSQVAGIIDQHGGHMEVDSLEKHGTTFTIYFPTIPTSKLKKLSTKTAVIPRGNQETILIVEDNKTIRAALADTITQLNYRVITATNGREALELIKGNGHNIHLVVSDLVMPEMGGQALFRAIRAFRPEMPVILLSGYPLQADLQNLQDQGVAGWLLKPPKIEKLAQLVTQALAEPVSV